MITGKGTIAVECVLVTEPTTIGGLGEFMRGDLLVSDGVRTWGMPYDQWKDTVRGTRMSGIRKAAEELVKNGE